MDNNSNRVLDDLTRVAGGALTVLSALGKQMQSSIKEKIGEEFHQGTSAANDDMARLQGSIAKLRTEQEELKKRIAVLEALLANKKAPKQKSANKAPVKKTSSVATKKPKKRA